MKTCLRVAVLLAVMLVCGCKHGGGSSSVIGVYHSSDPTEIRK